MKLSVIVVSHKVRELLRRCLRSIAHAAAGETIEVIVVDNASDDGTVEMVRAEFPGAKLIASKDNGGFSVAVNAGARVATGDVFLLLNPDAELPEGAVPRMFAFLRSHPNAWAAGFRQVDAHGNFQLAIGPRPTLFMELLRRVVQRRLDSGDVRLGTLVDQLCGQGPVGWVAGSSLLVRREAFEKVGGFDERFFLFFEDIDFCLRLRQAGGEIYYEPFLTVVHHRGASAKGAKSLSARAYRDSQLWFWEKHRGPWMRRLVHAYLFARGLSPRQLAT